MGQNGQRNYWRIPASIVNTALISLGFLILIWVNKPLFNLGVPYSHDGGHHLVRLAQYYLSIKEGQLPPRWAGQLNNSFGYPVFDFNYPLANILAYPLVSLDLSVINVYKVLIWLGLLGSFGGAYWLLCQHTSRTAAMVGSLVYVLNPYTANMIYVRGSMGELLAMSTLPWFLWGLTSLVKSKNPQSINKLLTVFFGLMFLLSHNVMAMLFTPIIVIYLIYIGYRDLAKTFRRTWFPILLAGLLSAFFWIPAVGEKSATRLDEVSINTGYRDHFLNPGQLLSGNWGYGFSYKGPVDGLDFSLGLSAILIIFVALVVSFKWRQKKLAFWLLILSGVLYFTLAVSDLWWQMIPLMKFSQFPWRWLLPGQFMVAFVTALLFQETSKWRVYWGLVLALLVIHQIQMAKPADVISKDSQALFYATETTSVLDENMPKWFDKYKAYQLKDEWFKEQVVRGEKESTTAKVAKWTGREHVYELTLTEPDMIVERLAYFVGWETKINGKLITVDYQNPKYPGLVTYNLPTGQYSVKTIFTENTTPRMIGDGLTLLGMGLLIIYSVALWQKSKKLSFTS
jgi:hypothetical protein